MSLLQLATVFFIIANPIGNSPAIVALIKDYTISEQQKILLRESLFSMIIALFFLFLGDLFLNSLKIQSYALTTSGGVLLFLVGLKMIFVNRQEDENTAPKQAPFIVPIATPLISGAGLMTMILLYSKQEQNNFKIFIAILLAWVGVTAVLVTAPYLQMLLGKRGLTALEQLMGMLLIMIAIGMIVDGLALFLVALEAV